MGKLQDNFKLDSLGIKKSYDKDEFLFSAGDRANGFFYVRNGEVRIFRMDDQGREIEIVRLGPGDYFGEAIVFVASTFPAYAQAVRKAQVLFFAKEIVQDAMGKDSRVGKFLIHLLANKCVVLNNRIEMLELQTVRQRLARFLLSRCSKEKNGLVQLQTKKAELAKYLGTISETLSRNLKLMQDEGLIDVRGSEIYIKDCSLLRSELSP